MRKEYAGEEIQARVIDIFEARRESEEPARMSLGELVREGARLMLETALEMEVESFLGRKRYPTGEPDARGV